MTAPEFLIKNAGAIGDLIEQVVGEAMAALPCLSLGSQQQCREQLKTAIDRAAQMRFNGFDGCTGAWEREGPFVVTIQDVDGEHRIDVSLALATSRVPQ